MYMYCIILPTVRVGTPFFNPRRACTGRVMVVVLCVSVSVCSQASCHIPRLWVEIEVSLGFSWRMKRVEFLENALFKSYGGICWSSRSSSLLDELSMHKRDSDGFFSTRVVYRSSYTSHSSTDSWLVTYLSIISFLALCVHYLKPHKNLGLNGWQDIHSAYVHSMWTNHTAHAKDFALWFFILSCTVHIGIVAYTVSIYMYTYMYRIRIIT